MATRREFISSLILSATLPSLTWADAGGPSYLAAAKEPDGSFSLIGLSDIGGQIFDIALPARGHAGASHPIKPEAVVFARRPGTFAMVINCVAGDVTHALSPPHGLHFNGHGVFSADGNTLFTSETENETGIGQIGVWNTSNNYVRSGSFPSGGLGPHEIIRIPNSNILAVANGGIITALDAERSKLNLDTMMPNLSYLTPDGILLEQINLPSDLHQNSIRHLAVASDGTVAFAMQWEGDPTLSPPLLGLHKQGTATRLANLPEHLAFRLKNYAASIAFNDLEDRVAITCPRGGIIARFDRSAANPSFLERNDVSGICPAKGGMLVTDGNGGVHLSLDNGLKPLAVHNRAWDNHLIKI